MAIEKPSFPIITETQLRRGVGQLEILVKGAQKSDGSLAVVDLQDRAQEAQNNPALWHGVKIIKDAFQRLEDRKVWDTCAKQWIIKKVHVDPESLSSQEVQTVLQALVQAKVRAKAMDKDGDKVINKQETAAASQVRPRKMDEKIAAAVLDAKLANYEKAMDAWAHILYGVATDVQARNNLDQWVKEQATFHAATTLGYEAVVWHYRDLLTQGLLKDRWTEINKELTEAEKSFLTTLLGGEPGRNHLDDGEISELYGTTDLERFVAAKKEAVTKRVGRYEDFLAGRGLMAIEGVEQLTDPDYVARASGGCPP